MRFTPSVLKLRIEGIREKEILPAYEGLQAASEVAGMKTPVRREKRQVQIKADFS